jgi:TonB family protein
MKKPELSDKEIFSHMQFDKLLEAYKSAHRVNSFRKWFYRFGYVVLTAVLISTVFYFSSVEQIQPDESNERQVQKSQDDSSSRSKDQLTQSVPKIESKKKVTQKVFTEKKDNTPTFDSVKKSKQSQFTEAEPVEGYSALYEYFDHELKYPGEATRDSIEGVVTVSFTINHEGKPESIKIENSLGVAFDKECQRIIKSMPTWRPATISSKPIATKLSIPLTFKIKK